ncbi:TPA: hypothetical protein J8J82_000998 [Legionella pneumophila]|nr:hypothetical protein [Legionella pneumophila]HBA1634955.1 hypothetical protein [Legionella pneumophila]
MSWSCLGLKSGIDLAQVFAAIHKNITSLDLSWNNFDGMSGAELAQALAAIPKGVTDLDLSRNHLGLMSGAELAQALAAIPKGVTGLNLSQNNLGDIMSGAELARVFAAIPPGVTSLNLTGNVLGISSAVLTQAFAAIPNTIVCLNLTSNGFGIIRNGAELAQLFAAIPAGVTSLDLRSTCLYRLSLADLALFKNSLSHIQTICLDVSEIRNMSKEQRQMLRAAFPNIQKIILVDDNNKEVDISESMELSNYIRELGLKTEVPSLLHQCGRFFKEQRMEINNKNVPEELKELVNS